MGARAANFKWQPTPSYSTDGFYDALSDTFAPSALSGTSS